MASFLHELVKDLTGMSAENRPWDYRVFWPSLNDEAVLTVSIKWKRGDDWIDYYFNISLSAAQRQNDG